MTKRRLLWIGDACVASGFARATHHILEVLHEHFDVHVLGLNYHGDPHPYPYPVYPCYLGGDVFGYGRVKTLVQKLGPAIVVVQNDPWNLQEYLKRIGNIPTVGVMAVDGKNCQGQELNGLSMAIFWTKFAQEQANLGGYTGPSTVIPLGVDLSIYQPLDRAMVRERMNLAQILAGRGLPPDTFIVGAVGKNQHRKRLDLTMQYFSEWVHSRNIKDAALWLHVAPTMESGYNLAQLAEYYRIADRLFLPDINPIHGVSEVSMARVYSLFDVLLSTTVGEGWGLPMQEAMACGVPCILPDWSALGEWATGAAWMVPCKTTAVAPGINTVGGIMDGEDCISALNQMYLDRRTREIYTLRGLELVQRPEYRWSDVGKNYLEVLSKVLRQPIGAEVWKEMGQPQEAIS